MDRRWWRFLTESNRSYEVTSMIPPLVSVLVPVYNAERYLNSAIRSVQNQTYQNLEIILVDDGSTDGSAAILSEMAAVDKRIVLISQKNGGISSALNQGILRASGYYVARMDADDLMLPHRIETQVRFLQENRDLGFCSSSMILIDHDDVEFGEYRPEPGTRAALEGMLKRRELVTYTHPTVMYVTELARALGGYRTDFEPCEDTEFFGRLISSGTPGLAMPDVLMKYRIHHGSISRQKVLRQIQMAELIRTNFYRRRDGQAEHDPRNLTALVGAMPYHKRLAYRLKIKARALRQVSRFDRASGRRTVAFLRLMSAAALQPHKAAVQGIQLVRRRLQY